MDSIYKKAFSASRCCRSPDVLSDRSLTTLYHIKKRGFPIPRGATQVEKRSMFQPLTRSHVPFRSFLLASHSTTIFENNEVRVGVQESRHQPENGGTGSIADPQLQNNSESSNSHTHSYGGGPADESIAEYQSHKSWASERLGTESKPPARKKSFSLPTVYLPAELQAALDNATLSKWINL